MEKPAIAASIYLNSAPLCYSFIQGSQREAVRFLGDRAPARCADMLREGRADVALIPVIEYQRIEGLWVAPGACVASRQRVRSVVLASKVAIEEVSSVALDTSSRTSAALIQIILNRFYGLAPRYEAAAPSLAAMLENHDAALMIGDPAMLIDRASLRVYDLAEEWRRHTGLPFVFAFWAARDGAPAGIDFAAAKREGLAHVEEIADQYAEHLGLPRQDLIEYMTENISYDLDEEALRGLKLYYELAYEEGLIEAARPLVLG